MCTDLTEGSATARFSPRRIFVAWEKLRIVYNSLLVALVLVLVLPNSPHDFQDAKFWWMMFQGAFAANVAFFAGPIAESYINWLEFYHFAVRVTLFVAGTLLALLLAYATLYSFAMAGF